jgi:ATP-dependent Lon protease
MSVEVAVVPGRGEFKLTGSLGDVMKESVHIALSLVRGHAADLGCVRDLLRDGDLHVHVPAGAIPKDGPSAGLAMAAAIASLFSGRAILPRHAMTGEISLRGRILPVGGVKEKVLAAARAGIATVLLPEQNQCDLEELPADVRDQLRFVFCRDAMAALNLLLEPMPGPAR